MTAEAILEARGLAAKRDGRAVLHGIDLSIRPGEVVAIIGPNGAGKSTLLSVLAGTIAPSAGAVTPHGSIALALQAPGLARRSARANVELALSWWKVPRGERRTRADAALATLRATHLADRTATQLSGGEQRRVHLARALSLEPDILLLDEPFEGLDPESRSALLEDAASALRTRSGATVIVVHDRREAFALADRVLMLFDGRIVGDGAPQSLLDAPATPDAARFLGYDGELRRSGRLVLTRARNVVIDPAGEPATVLQVTPVEDGFRVKLGLGDGFVFALVAERPGADLRVRIDGGASFDAE